MSRIDSAVLDIAANPSRVFTALVDPQSLVAWLPPAGMTGTIEGSPAAVGSSFRMVLTYDDAKTGHGKTSDRSDVVDTRVVEVVTGRTVVWETDFVSDDPAYAGTMTMTWTVEPAGTGSQVTVSARDVPTGITEEDHLTGLRSSIENLRDFLANAPSQ